MQREFLLRPVVAIRGLRRETLIGWLIQTLIGWLIDWWLDAMQGFAFRESFAGNS